MSIRKKPDRAVTILLARLDRAKNDVLSAAGDDASNTLESQFIYIRGKLENINQPLQRFKTREKSIIDELCELEKELDDNVFNPTTHHMEQVLQKLKLIRGKVDWLDNFLSMVEPKLTKDLRTAFPKPIKEKPSLNDEHRPTMSEEWASYQIENEILKSEEMVSNFSSRFHCLESNQVKMCLLYLSIFPENAVIKKRPLIYWWMGEELVMKNESKTAEEVGEEVFNELLKERFIKAETKSQWPIVNSFTVDPWIRRMLMVEAKKCKFIDFSPDGKVCNGEWSRALLLQGNDELYNIDGEREASLWTVFNVNDKILRIKPNWGFGKLKRVKVLQLGRWQNSTEHHIEVENKEILNGVGSSEHLKYLSLRGISLIEALPKSIFSLPSLEILDLRACHNLERLPDGIWALNNNLTHLDVSECYLLEIMPKGLQQLRSLQVLKGFVTGKAHKNSCRLTDLWLWNKLRKLSIRVVGDDYVLDLSSFSSLQILTVSWRLDSPVSAPSMSLPPSLNKLDLRCLPFTELPFTEPLSNNLEKLYICGGKLNRLSGNKTVKFLRLKYLKDLSIHGEELEFLFPEYVFIQKFGCGAPCPHETIEKSGTLY